MAKRKKRKSTAPNLPDEVLERARKQLDGTLEEDETDGDPTPEAAEETVEPVAESEKEPETAEEQPAPVAQSTRTTTTRSSRRRERRRSSSSGGPTVVQRNKSSEMDSEQIAHLLANPTKVVSEEELHEEYGYVLRDLRNMGVLAVLLMVVLVLLAQLI